jgi:hypothetical protein
MGNWFAPSLEKLYNVVNVWAELEAALTSAASAPTNISDTVLLVIF